MIFFSHFSQSGYHSLQRSFIVSLWSWSRVGSRLRLHLEGGIIALKGAFLFYFPFFFFLVLEEKGDTIFASWSFSPLVERWLLASIGFSIVAPFLLHQRIFSGAVVTSSSTIHLHAWLKREKLGSLLLKVKVGREIGFYLGYSGQGEEEKCAINES